MLFLQFALSFTGTLQQAKDRHVGMGAGSCVKMASNRKVRVLIAHRPKVLSKAITQSTLGLSDIEETTLGAANAILLLKCGHCFNTGIKTVKLHTAIHKSSNVIMTRCFGFLMSTEGQMLGSTSEKSPAFLQNSVT